MEILADRLVRFRRAISSPDELLNLVETEGNWRPSGHTIGPNGREVRYDCHLEVKGTDLGNQIRDAVIKYLPIFNENIPEVDRYINGFSIVQINFGRYEVGGGIGTHGDDHFTEDNGLFTVAIYLNDDYEGGELGFPDYGIEIKPEPGDVFMFPCYYQHYANVTTSGIKYFGLLKVNTLEHVQS